VKILAGQRAASGALRCFAHSVSALHQIHRNAERSCTAAGDDGRSVAGSAFLSANPGQRVPRSAHQVTPVTTALGNAGESLSEYVTSNLRTADLLLPF
jgi:hypothetical protein